MTEPKTWKLLTVRTPLELKTSFEYVCAQEGTTASEAIRRFMHATVTDAAVKAYAAKVAQERGR